MTFEKCAITGILIKPEEYRNSLTTFTLSYETNYVGKVNITHPAYVELLHGDFECSLIGGICLERTLQNKEPIMIDSNFIREGYKKENPPSTFDEKCNHFLKFLYKNGGNENKEFQLNSTIDFLKAFANPEEFSRIVDYLENEGFISIRGNHKAPMGHFLNGVKVTSEGKKEAIKSLPKMPLFGLVSQEIKSGNHEIDEKINHARKLFFDSSNTMDTKRSACETLSYVLEPLRENLKDNFNNSDVSFFFQLVNTFDIRHNKETTKTIIHEEQLEWIFYTLLNTINTYVKLEKKLKYFGKNVQRTNNSSHSPEASG
jgi:hypothetical protein